MKTISRETVTLLTFTGDDFWPVTKPTGYVRVPGGYISSHAAYELVIAGKLNPEQNAAAVAREDNERKAAQRAIEAKHEQRQRDERQHRIDAAQHEAEQRAKREAEHKAANDAALAGVGVQRA